MYRVKSCGIPAGGPASSYSLKLPGWIVAVHEARQDVLGCGKEGGQGAPVELYGCCRGAGLATKIPAAWLKGEVYVLAGRKGQLAVGRDT